MRRHGLAVAATLLVLPGCSLTDPDLFASSGPANGRALISRSAYAAPSVPQDVLALSRAPDPMTMDVAPVAALAEPAPTRSVASAEPAVPGRPVMVASVDTGTRSDAPALEALPPELVYREDREGRVLLPRFQTVPVIDISATLRGLHRVD